jgi:four helix bundle protein
MNADKTQPDQVHTYSSVRHLDVYQVLMQLMDVCSEFLPSIKRFNKRTHDQLIESLFSSLQNTREGLRRTGKDSPHLLGVALASCCEVRGILDGVHLFRIIVTQKYRKADDLADRACAMLYRLRQRRQ